MSRMVDVYRKEFLESGQARRFWAKVERPRSDGCWLWTATTSGGAVRYGQFTVGPRHRRRLAHRVSWEVHKGPIPDGMFVLHRCDNGLCVNPRHLFLGTAADNTRDMMAKGRWRGGSPPQKLTADQVLAIRRIYARRDASQYTLAREYGVSQSTINRIVRSMTWKEPLRFIDEGDPVAEVSSE